MQENREEFEKLVARVLARTRKHLFGKGPTTVSVALRKHYLICELYGFCTPAQETLLTAGYLANTKKIEQLISSAADQALTRWLEEITDLKILAISATIIPATRSKILLFVADRPWQEAQLQAPINRSDLTSIINTIQKNIINR